VRLAMIKFYKTSADKLSRIDTAEEGCWVSVIAPTEEELQRISTEIGVVPEFLHAALDEEETSRIETEDGQTLILVGIPCAEKHDNTVSYTVLPMGIIITSRNILTVCLKDNSIISDFADGLVKNAHTQQKTRFVLQIMMRMSARFLQYLRQINKITSYIEKQLYGLLRNKELIQLFDLGKSLVYFSASLKANEVTLEKLLRGRVIKLTEEEHDLLEDALIEVKQAVDMEDIYSSILSGTIEAFSSVRSNNLIRVMKTLISVVIVLFIPIIIFAFYSMNISVLPMPFFWFPLTLSAVAMLVAGLVLHHKKMF
jgi:magnesium transporter